MVKGLLLQAVPDVTQLGVAHAGAALVAVGFQAHEASEEVEEPEEVHEDAAHLRGLSACKDVDHIHTHIIYTCIYIQYIYTLIQICIYILTQYIEVVKGALFLSLLGLDDVDLLVVNELSDILPFQLLLRLPQADEGPQSEASHWIEAGEEPEQHRQSRYNILFTHISIIYYNYYIIIYNHTYMT